MKRDEFEKNMAQLLSLLKKMLKQPPVNGFPFLNPSDLKNELKGLGNLVVNVCFFNFIPMTQEEMDELEQAYAEALGAQETETDSHERNETHAAGGFHWNQDDVDFLKQHGMTL